MTRLSSTSSSSERLRAAISTCMLSGELAVSIGKPPSYLKLIGQVTAVVSTEQRVNASWAMSILEELGTIYAEILINLHATEPTLTEYHKKYPLLLNCQTTGHENLLKFIFTIYNKRRIGYLNLRHTKSRLL